jgi:TfoX/Sxy family transcriptional regulator of competence genes
MAYDLNLAERVRERLARLQRVEEKKMMGGLCFMYNDKMCLCVLQHDLMVRLDPDLQEQELSKQGVNELMMSGRPSKGYVLVNNSILESDEAFEYWVKLALDFNPRAKSSKKRVG